MRLRATLALLPAVLLTGCTLVDTHTPELGTTSSSVSGTVIGGQQPVANSTVTVYQVGTSGYGSGATQMAQTTTDSGGNFSFASTAYSCTSSTAPMYITATGGDSGAGNNANLAMISSLGPCSGAKAQHVVINEVTTAATVFAMAQFFNTTLGSAQAPTIGGPSTGGSVYTKGLVAAMNNTVPALVDISSGSVKTSSTSGTVTTTIESAKINAIANVLAACINTNGNTGATTPCGKLFTYTTPPGGTTTPSDTVQAALMMALYPYQNVSNLYNLTTATPPFVGLTTTPNDWTVAVSYANSALGVGINGSAPHTSMSMDIDTNGRPWFTSTKTGAVGVAYFDPSSQTFNGPYNATSNGVTHPQYVAIDQSGTVWASDQNGANIVGVSTSTPTAVTALTVSGATSVGPVMVDYSNQVTALYNAPNGLDMVTFDTTHATQSSVNVSTNTMTGTGLVDETVSFHGAMVEAASSPCSLYDDGRGGSWFQVASVGTNCSSGMASPAVRLTTGGYPAVYSVGSATTANQLCDDFSDTCQSPAVGVVAPEGVATDGNNQLWVANSGNGSISTMGSVSSPATPTTYAQTATSPYLHDATHGGTMTNPFALAIDASGNVWTVSPGCVDSSTTPCTPGAMVLTEMVGAAGPSTTPLSQAMYNTNQEQLGTAGANSGLGSKPQS